ncbi:MAG: hypothetical protein AB7F86_19485 [Bdellovibrionales bacterium]
MNTAKISPVRFVFTALVLYLISWTAIQIGVWLGESYVPSGPGLKDSPVYASDLFRFDSEYYLRIADSGYFYDGNPNSSPNIVFAPVFPVLVKTLSSLSPLSLVSAGFVVNAICLVGGILFLLIWLTNLFGFAYAILGTLFLVTSAGAYSLHAFYSEASALFFLTWSCLALSKKSWGQLAIASAILSGTRVSMAPIAAIIAIVIMRQALRERRLALIGYSLASVSGLVVYLGYIAISIGNPFELFPKIQSHSWGLYHPEVDWTYYLGPNLIDYFGAVLDRGFGFPLDIRTLNLAWLVLATFGCMGFLRYDKRNPVAWMFTAGLIFLYLSDAGSEYLISFHRFAVLILPCFFLPVWIHTWLSKRNRPKLAHAMIGLLLTINLVYCILHTAFFHRGVWFFF